MSPASEEVLDRQHRVGGDQSQRRHGRGRSRRLPVPQRRRGRRDRAGPESRHRSAARSCASRRRVSRRRATRSSPPAGHGPVRAAPVGGGVRGDLRARAAQPVPHRVRPELGDDTLPDQRRRRGTWEEVDDGSRRRQLRLAAPRGAVPDRTDGRLLDRPEFHRPGDRLRPHGRPYIVGGAFVPNGWWGPGYDGAYLFADGDEPDVAAQRGRCRRLLRAVHDVNLSVTTDLTFGVRNGERALFYVNNGNGQLRKIVGPERGDTQAGGRPTSVAPVPRRPAQLPQPPVQSVPGAPRVHRLPGRAARARHTERDRRADGSSRRWAAATVPSGCRPARAPRCVNFTLDNGAAGRRTSAARRAISSRGSRARRCRPRRTPTSAAATWPPTRRWSRSTARRSTEVQVYADVDVIIDVLGYYTLGQSAGERRTVRRRSPRPSARHRARRRRPATTTPASTSATPRSCASPSPAARGVPAGATTVSLTVTAIGPGSDASGYVTAFAGGTPCRRRRR